MIITIDGPVGTGKSTIAKRLADELGFVYFDTGAMYRCATYGVIKHAIDPTDDSQMSQFIETFNVDIKVEGNEKYYFFENEDITHKIRGEAVTSSVSEVSAIRTVREKLVEMQRKLSVGVNAVFEGRDMGTHVFPDAKLKIFLTATPEVRAQRRFDEFKEKFPDEIQGLTVKDVMENLNTRDIQDSTRELSPLRQAEDAHVVDTSDLTIEDVIAKILDIKENSVKT